MAKKTEASAWVGRAMDCLRGSSPVEEGRRLLLAVIFLRALSGAPDDGPVEDGPRWQDLVVDVRRAHASARREVERAWTAWAWRYPGLLDEGPDFAKLPEEAESGLRQLIDWVDGTDRPADFFEACLQRFSADRSGGEYYTPRGIVSLLVDMLEPEAGDQVFDPVCGSGGFLVAASQYVRERYGPHAHVELGGQEVNAEARSVALMNLAVHGLEGDLGARSADSLREDLFFGKTFDVVLANPPFNMSRWNDGVAEYDPRWRYGVPPKGNANFAWVQHVLSKLSHQGRGAILLANGAASGARMAERSIREALVRDDVLDCLVALPAGLFPHTRIPACAWFFSAAKAPQHRGKVLFIDARELGTVVSRGRRELSREDSDRISDTYVAWKGGEYEDVPGWCRSVGIHEIEIQEFDLMPNRYAGAALVETADDGGGDRIEELTRELLDHFAEAERLDARLRGILGQL
ncbi:N-6 DNA methylase [Streptomyces sp. NPDC046261]|uniref:N-6 DNA methylase n=1 Tax=Streptomyces sp. NPDC046261 TaxID=3157200 RepID=UPI0033D4E52D